MEEREKNEVKAPAWQVWSCSFKAWGVLNCRPVSSLVFIKSYLTFTWEAVSEETLAIYKDDQLSGD